ncbi:MAG: transferrin-binding protein-like solute binding protein [Loktanella sp.]|nr:transferrin-binding protein-like solute binding protein [Loktanella sp.]
MKLHSKFSLVGVALGALAACSDSDTVTPGITINPEEPGITISPEEEALRVMAVQDDGNTIDAGGAIAGGEVLTARSVSVAAQSVFYGDGETFPIDATVQVERNPATGEVTLTLNGEPYDFTTADRSGFEGTVFGYDVSDRENDKFVAMWNWTGPLDDLLASGSGFAEAIEAQSNLVPGGPNVRVFAVVGAETADADLSGLPTATYDGSSTILFTPNEGFDGSEDETQLRSRLTMTADFGAGTVSGNLSELKFRDGRGERRNAAGKILLNTAEFGVNGFEGTISPDATYATNGELSINSGSYSGAFYGPVANEIGGVISAAGDRGAEPVNGIGFFHGEQN